MFQFFWLMFAYLLVCKGKKCVEVKKNIKNASHFVFPQVVVVV